MTQLVLAVDAGSLEKVRDIIARTKGLVDYYKFGSIPFTVIGPELVKMGHAAGACVFLDLKYHDIPNTVAGAAEAAVLLGVDMFNVHCCGGREMLLRTMEKVQTVSTQRQVKPPIVLGVTVLTSMNEQSWAATYGIPEHAVMEQVRHFALLAGSCGLNGVVSSPREIEVVKQACGKDFLVLTPGIRMPDAPVSGDDQARTLTPGEAAAKGADFIVVGRPIIQAQDPAAVCTRIRQDIQTGTTGEHG
jgi:orotidine-5'-phosphate decarboxylase